jgi:UrcA family protein
MTRSLIFAAAAGLASALTVAAATPASAQVELVSTRGLDLASPDGRAALDRRIGFAAKRICTVNCRPCRARPRRSPANARPSP